MDYTITVCINIRDTIVNSFVDEKAKNTRYIRQTSRKSLYCINAVHNLLTLRIQDCCQNKMNFLFIDRIILHDV